MLRFGIRSDAWCSNRRDHKSRDSGVRSICFALEQERDGLGMGKSGDRHCSWKSQADSALCFGAGTVASWIHQGASLRGGISESAASHVQPAGNSAQELDGETESASHRCACDWRPCHLGVSWNEQEFLSVNWPRPFVSATLGLILESKSMHN